MKYEDLINFRWGSEPQGNIERKSLAKKWLFIKPDIGNLSAAAQVPFSSFTSIPYFGGYPSGFSTYEYCAWATPEKCKNDKLIGFTHFSFSGCGDLHDFHNYFLIKPSENPTSVTKEKYNLDGYDIETPVYKISVLINKRSCFYKIRSSENVTLIPGYHGLNTKKYGNEIVKSTIKNGKNFININVDYPFINLYWTIKLISGKIIKIDEKQIILSKNAEFFLSYSILDFRDSQKQITKFNRNEASLLWKNCLSVFDIKDNNDYKKMFYTALMFALKKPFIYDDEHVYDFATMWDIYKTLLPLIFLFYKDEASVIVNNMLKMVDKNGVFYHANLFSKFPPTLSDQAICLINISISTAYLYGVKFDKKEAMALQKNEIVYYLRNLDKLDRYTYLLDLCDAIVAYYNAYKVDLGLEKVKTLIDLAFEKDKVYLNRKAEYYEGNYSNYSFRVSSSTTYRLKNDKKIISALDEFFGFKGKDTKRFIVPTSPTIVKNYMKTTPRFEGLNNEPDMESMYLYSYFNCFDKQNKVIKDVIENSFSLKNNGVPGNDDNGGLSSWLVLNLLGIFPVVGTNKIKIGLPFFKEVVAGKLTIKKHAKNNNAINIDKVLFNNKEVKNNEISASDINKGGVLDIYLK